MERVGDFKEEPAIALNASKPIKFVLFLALKKPLPLSPHRLNATGQERVEGGDKVWVDFCSYGGSPLGSHGTPPSFSSKLLTTHCL